MNDNHHPEAVYLDLEWTCWNSPPPPGMQQEIIEVGIVALDLNELEIVGEASYYVRPRRWEISPMCTEITGITEEDIRSARPLGEVLETLKERFQPRGKPCYAWGEDISILAQKCSSIKLASPFGRSLDLSRILQAAFAAKEQMGLKAATEMLGIDFDGFAHGALPDARNTARVHASILRRLRREPDPIDRPSLAGTTAVALSPFAQKLSGCLKK